IEHWNDGRATTREFGDDLAFARELTAALVADAGVDPARVYATGASNGGMMTLRLACEANDVIAAFAPVIASFPVPYVSRCRPERPVDILMINGDSDRLIRWGGGRIPKGRRAGVGGEVIPVPDTVDWWRAHNGCSNPQREQFPDRADDGTTVVRERHGRCDGGSVTFIAVEGGGHTWPGSPVPANRLAGRISQEISASQVIWQFFDGKHL
ncbi:MAG: hydrolase, partial [Pseudomonadota bacterium]